jgi:hypothetical protein
LPVGHQKQEKRKKKNEKRKLQEKRHKKKEGGLQNIINSGLARRALTPIKTRAIYVWRLPVGHQQRCERFN